MDEFLEAWHPTEQLKLHMRALGSFQLLRSQTCLNCWSITWTPLGSCRAPDVTHGLCLRWQQNELCLFTIFKSNHAKHSQELPPLCNLANAIIMWNLHTWINILCGSNPRVIHHCLRFTMTLVSGHFMPPLWMNQLCLWIPPCLWTAPEISLVQITFCAYKTCRLLLSLVAP